MERYHVPGNSGQVLLATAAFSLQPLRSLAWGVGPLPQTGYHQRCSANRPAGRASTSPVGFPIGQRSTWYTGRQGGVPTGGIIVPAAVGDESTQQLGGESRGRWAQFPSSSSIDDVSPESLARARQAAKNDDYEWFMEFIEGNEREDDSSNEDGAGVKGSKNQPLREDRNLGRNARENDSKNQRRGVRVVADAERDSPGDEDRHQRENNRFDDVPAERRPRAWRAKSTGDRDYEGNSRRVRPFDADRNSCNDNGQERGSGRRKPTPADTAYDYDLDDEFEAEPGRGGWEYDPGLTAGFAARRQYVDVGRVRSRARVAAKRMPMADEDDMVNGGQGQRDVGGASGKEQKSKASPINPEKTTVLIGELGYTEQEVLRMDPDMADLAVNRKLRRPAAGMPPDWSTSEDVAFTSPPSFDGEIKGDQERENDGSLDLEALLRSSEDEQEGWGQRSGLEARDLYDDPPPSKRSGYYDDGGRLGFEDDVAEDGWDGVRRRKAGRGAQTRRKRAEGRAKGGVEMDPAERYELNMRGDGTEIYDDAEEKSIWTGIGEEGPWPSELWKTSCVLLIRTWTASNVIWTSQLRTWPEDGINSIRGRCALAWSPAHVIPFSLEDFTKMLRDETDVRLSLIGPWAADVVAVENKFRLGAYKKWLEILDKGVGETLEESGFFDGAFRDDGDYYDDDDYYSNDYDGPRGRRRSGYEPRGRIDERGFDYEEDREYRGGDEPRERQQRPSSRGKARASEGPDLSAFLSSGANPANWGTPAEGLEVQAARFERDYPGNKRRRSQGPRREVDMVDHGRFTGEPTLRSQQEASAVGRGGRRYKREVERDAREEGRGYRDAVGRGSVRNTGGNGGRPSRPDEPMGRGSTSDDLDDESN